MAGSFNHCVVNGGTERDQPLDLRLLDWKRLNGMLETTSGDVVEAIEELYGMIWWLADRLSWVTTTSPQGRDVTGLVLEARDRYRDGLEVSPGTVSVHEVLPGWEDDDG